MAAFSKYIIYADESGSPTVGQDPHFPIFVLNFLLVEKRVYFERLVPEVQRIKFHYFGHDQVILHERDIRRNTNQFAMFRSNRPQGERFIEDLSRIFATSDAQLICSVIDKQKLKDAFGYQWSPYDIALGMCMEVAARRLSDLGETGTDVHVVFEARGSNEDKHLELEFLRVANGQSKVVYGHSETSQFAWSPIFADKRVNSTGLQLVDLAARPLGLSYLRPHQPNRAFSIMRTGFAAGGIRTFP
jgi:Protein of unknown function (DUF3800)